MVVFDDDVAGQRPGADAHTLEEVQGVDEPANHLGVAVDTMHGNARLPPAAPALRDDGRHGLDDALRNARGFARPVRAAECGDEGMLIGAGRVEGDEDVARQRAGRGGAYSRHGAKVVLDPTAAPTAPERHVYADAARTRMHDLEVLHCRNRLGRLVRVFSAHALGFRPQIFGGFANAGKQPGDAPDTGRGKSGRLFGETVGDFLRPLDVGHVLRHGTFAGRGLDSCARRRRH